ncbi:OsmC family protein [Flavobacterium piscis]|uniref:Peroxiredoxin-like protein n=1 Tax=Flavobacterium piscis TaxID=1114874 RepID=A0ABU1Y7Q2_9FLAO|nr:OsmC family protein [Flavobacterium piscis]MDR7210255.1 peroxiredoxin-like protein [Flavobacterium piscis]
MSDKHKYQVKLNWIEDRKGTLQSDVLNTKIEVVTPPEFPKGIPGLWSPEHLFVASVNSCFMTTFLAVAENSKLEFTNFECNAIGTLDRMEGKFCITEITLSPILTIKDETFRDKGIRVMEMSEKACLISNSITSKVILQPEVRIEP